MADRPLNVLFVSHQAHLYGGAQRSMLTLLTHIDRQLIQPIVMVPDEPGTLPNALKQANIRVITRRYAGWLSRPDMLVPARAAAHLLINLRESHKLWPALRNQHIDLVYTNTLYSPIGALIARRLGLPHIWHAREFVHEDLGMVYDWGTPLSMGFINRSSVSVICNSHAVMNKLTAHIPREKCAVVYNGFPELEEWQTHSAPHELAANEPVRLGLIGHVLEHKGHLDAIRALQLVANRYPQIELWIIGTGDDAYIARLRQLAVELGVHDRIVWKGFVEDMRAVWETLDIALVCSRSEAFGRVVVEAMAHHRPVIAANAGGIPEIIEEERTGLLYPPDDFQALAKQVERLISDHTLYRRIVSEAAASIQPRFSVQQYVSAISKIIRAGAAR